MKISGSVCDSSLKLSYIGIWQLLEDSVTEYMHGLDVDGLVAIRRYGAMWVFSAARAKIFRRPVWQEEILVTTGFYAKEKVRLGIETRFTTPKGELLICIHTEACAIDLETKRIRRIDTVGIDETIPQSEAAVSFSRIHWPAEGFEEEDRVLVKSTNIDYLYHVNNIEYLRFILNTRSVAVLEDRELTEVEMEYRGQAYEGETLTVEKALLDDVHYYLIRRGEDVMIRARLKEKQQ